MRRTALLAFGVWLASSGLALAQGLPEGIFASSKEGCAKLKEKSPVVLERRSFRRFLADDVPVNAVSVIDLPPAARATVDRRYLVVLTLIIGGAMIAALARALGRS